MCQLLGMTSNTSASIHFSFTGFAQRGGRTADHIDGWGIAFYERSGCRVFHDAEPASDSPLARFVREYPIKSRTVIAHLRKATQGEVSLANCHPFQREWLGQTWLFANNGDLRNFHPELNGNFLPVGTTDSEKAFCFVMQELRNTFRPNQRAPRWSDLATVLADVNRRIARHGNFNYLLSNGEAMFAHCSSSLYLLQRQHPFPTARLVDFDLEMDLGQLNGQHDQMAVIATEPLTHGEQWVPFKTGETKVFVDGQEAWSHVDDTTVRFPVACHSTGRAWLGAGGPAASGAI